MLSYLHDRNIVHWDITVRHWNGSGKLTPILVGRWLKFYARSHDTSVYPDGSDWIGFSGSVTMLQSGKASRSLSLNLISPRMAIIGSTLALLGMGTLIFRDPMPSTSVQLLQNKSIVESAGSVVVPNPGEPAEILFNAGKMSKMVIGNLQGNTSLYQSTSINLPL